MAKGIKTGGRKKGTPNRRTAEREAALKAAATHIEGAIPGAFEGDAHALLISIYKNPEQPINLRVDAARAAIGYEKPRLVAREHNLKSEPIKVGLISFRDLDEEECTDIPRSAQDQRRTFD